MNEAITTYVTQEIVRDLIRFHRLTNEFNTLDFENYKIDLEELPQTFTEWPLNFLHRQAIL